MIFMEGHFLFNEQLIAKITLVLKRDYGVEITRDEALVWLDSLADLYATFSAIRRESPMRRQSPPAPHAGGGVASRGRPKDDPSAYPC